MLSILLPSPVRLAGVLAFACLAAAQLGACATVDQRCREETADCLRRCQAATPDTDPALTSRPPDITLSECESRCGCRRDRPPAAAPTGTPTPTGTE